MKPSLWKLALMVAPLLFTSCDTLDFRDKEEKPPLKGDRISVMELQKKLEADTEAAANAEPYLPPETWINAYWPQVGGYPTHSMQNLAFTPDQPEKAWSVDIGKGSTRRYPLTASPIVVDGMIYALDSRNNLSAYNIENGAVVWRVNVQKKEEEDPAITGGIAYGEGKIFVTNGYNEVIALNPKTGKGHWKTTIATPSRAAPTIINGRVFIATLDGRLVALETATGAVAWEYVGVNETAALVGAASPAASRDIVIPVFASGEIGALRTANGSTAWADNLGQSRRFEGLTSIADINALPVIDRDVVFSVSYSGILAAIDLRTGRRIWQRNIGSANTPWIAGDHIFLISAENDLISLNRNNGVIRWVKTLPLYRDKDKKEGRLFWTGPIMAEGRLIVASTDGRIAEITSENGELIRTWETDDSVVHPPILANKTLYVLSEDGILSAYR